MELNERTLRSRQRTGKGLLALVLLLVVLLALSGCAAAPVAQVPVAVSCVDKRPVRPGLRTEAEILAMDDYRAILAYRSELKKRDTYIGELEDIVTVCERAPRVVTVPALEPGKEGR